MSGVRVSRSDVQWQGGLCRLHNINTDREDREVLINMKLKNVCNSRLSLNEAKHFAV